MIEEIPEDIKSNDPRVKLKIRCPFGNVPILEFEGRPQCDEIVDAVQEFQELCLQLFQAEIQDRPIIMENVIPAARKRFLRKFNQQIKRNGGHIVGNALTWADIWVVHHVSRIEGLLKISLTDKFPALRTLINMTFNEPSLRHWIITRPYTLC
ncbi:unnamed protein product [Allacma fusca]|uniref:GST C-terminal domain-containing protein n=1 Tax=Allacma fusca TaxID=39272 RepID=A0A8J2K5S8_9HEXA|nr:unnamed protein product [Allacma fusca]